MLNICALGQYRCMRVAALCVNCIHLGSSHSSASSGHVLLSFDFMIVLRSHNNRVAVAKHYRGHFRFSLIELARIYL